MPSINPRLREIWWARPILREKVAAFAGDLLAQYLHQEPAGPGKSQLPKKPSTEILAFFYRHIIAYLLA
jgi:hypothetical protein